MNAETTLLQTPMPAPAPNESPVLRPLERLYLRFNNAMMPISLGFIILGVAVLASSWNYALLAGVASGGIGIALFFIGSSGWARQIDAYA